MKSIEERAKEWGEYIVETTPYDVVAAKYSYIAGANAQKEIDDAELLKLKAKWEINHDMKSIKERAKEYSKDHWNELTAKEAYIAGATDQKAIDDALLLKLKSSWEEEAQINHNDESNYKQGYHDAVEKACEWLKKELQELAMDEVKDSFLENDFKVILKSQVPDWLRDFRKAMEE